MDLRKDLERARKEVENVQRARDELLKQFNLVQDRAKAAEADAAAMRAQLAEVPGLQHEVREAQDAAANAHREAQGLRAQLAAEQAQRGAVQRQVAGQPGGAAGGAAAAAAPPDQAPRHRGNAKIRLFANNQGEDWLTFKEHVKVTCRLNGYNEADSKLALASAMDGSAAVAVRDLAYDGPETFEQQLARYEARFLPASASELSKTRFETSRQQKHESLLDWVSRARALYLKGWPDEEFNEARLVRHLVQGILRKDIRTQVMRERPATVQEMLEAAQHEAAVNFMTRYVETGSMGLGGEAIGEVGALQRRLGGGPRPPMRNGSTGGAAGSGRTSTGSSASTANRDADLRCFYCDILGHRKRDCSRYRAALEEAARKKVGRPAGRVRALHEIEGEEEELAEFQDNPLQEATDQDFQ